MNNAQGIKEIYDISIRVNTPIKIGDRQYDINETVLYFDRGELAQIQENKNIRQATGGFHDNLLIEWQTDKNAQFQIIHGVLSKMSIAALSNSKIGTPKIKSVSFKETCSVQEIDGKYCIKLKYKPNVTLEKMGLQGNPENKPFPIGHRVSWIPLKPMPPSKDKFIFCYDADTGQKIQKFEIYENIICFKKPHKNILVEYTFNYEDKIIEIDVGNPLFKGFLSISAKTTVKDYITGEPKTAIIEFPKVKLHSSLSLSLGTAAMDTSSGVFNFTSYPEEGRDEKSWSVFNLYFLDTELTEEYL